MSKYMIQNFDDELWQRFKMLCVMEKVSMRKKIEELIKEEVEKARRRYGGKEKG